jgi:hypothetical protein
MHQKINLVLCRKRFYLENISTDEWTEVTNVYWLLVFGILYLYREEILFWKIEGKPAKLLLMTLSYYSTCKPYYTRLFINL